MTQGLKRRGIRFFNIRCLKDMMSSINGTTRSSKTDISEFEGCPETTVELSLFNGIDDSSRDVKVVRGGRTISADLSKAEKTLLGDTCGIDENGHEPLSKLQYGLRVNPPLLVNIMTALQNVLLSIAGCLTASQVVADSACAPFDHPARSQLFCTTIFMVGVCTFLQTAFGVRLPIFQGPSSSFLVPLLALQRDPAWACDAIDDQPHDLDSASNITDLNQTTSQPMHDPTPGIYWRLQAMSGSIMVAALSEVILGGLGLLKPLLRFIGPITVACTVSLIGVSLFKLPIIYGKSSYSLTIGCSVLVLIFVLYCKNITLPLPQFGNQSGTRKRLPIFQLIPILLALLLMWILTWILTVANVFPDNLDDQSYMARTDAKISVIDRSKWLQITYPGQFGAPSFSPALTIGFLVAFFASMVESVGDYYAASKACMAPHPPDHAVSRGIFIEGLGSILSGSVGAGHATTSYSANIALLSVSRTVSRSVMYTAAIILIGISLLGKAGASLTTIPNPLLGGVMMVLIGTLFSIGIENLGRVDMTSSRNMVVMGFPFMTAITIPLCLDKYPDIIDTGNQSIDQVLKVILGMPMFLGGALALFLDNTVPGTLVSRGLAPNVENIQIKSDPPKGDDNDEKSHQTKDATPDYDVYSWAIYPRLLKIFPALASLPFMPGFPTKT